MTSARREFKKTRLPSDFESNVQSHGITTATHMKHETATDILRTHVELDGKSRAVQNTPTWISKINVRNDPPNLPDDL